VAKYISVGLAVASGLCGGNEGPMIAIGAAVGKVLSQGTQLRNGCTLAPFKRFRNMYDRRNFISAGAAAGVASAFGAPVGGLLFVLEEISSFWSHHLAWTTFFCCMCSAITTELITNSFEAFRFTGQFGLFTDKSYANFVDVAMKSQLYMFLPVGACSLNFTISRQPASERSAIYPIPSMLTPHTPHSPTHMSHPTPNPQSSSASWAGPPARASPFLTSSS
jgi:hypothetical protein